MVFRSNGTVSGTFLVSHPASATDPLAGCRVGIALEGTFTVTQPDAGPLLMTITGTQTSTASMCTDPSQNGTQTAPTTRMFRVTVGVQLTLDPGDGSPPIVLQRPAG